MDKTVSSQCTSLICEGKDKEARALLDKDPVSSPEWFYLNALLKFKELGDCIQSRSAATAALEESELIGDILTPAESDYGDNDQSDDDDDDDEDAVDDFDVEESDEEKEYAHATLPAWQKTAGALDWLAKLMDIEYKMFGAADFTDEERFKKWQREVELADSHLRREDFKSTKRAFKTALREADSLDDGGDMFLLTVKMLGSLLLEYGETLEDLGEALDKKITWLDEQKSDDTESLFVSYSEFAEIAMELGMTKRAEHCAERAVAFFEKSKEKKSEKLDLHHGAECLFEYAAVLSELEKFQEAEGRFAQLIKMQEEYLGTKHLSLIDGLMGLRFCLHEQKKHDEEKLIYDRLFSIDENFDTDDEFRFVCDAALVKTDH